MAEGEIQHSVEAVVNLLFVTGEQEQELLIQCINNSHMKDHLY
jgi:hypothetical protein